MNCAIRVATAIFLLTSAEVRADPASDCNDGSNLTRQIRGCTQVIQKTLRSDAVSTAYMNRAIAYAQRGQYNKALADFTAAIHADGSNNFAYYNRGNIYLDMRKPRQAIADYTKAVEIASDMSPALLNRALAHEMLGEREESIADFRAAVELEPTLTAAYDGLKRLGATPRAEEGNAAAH
ncbi:tetratricopeptide repeat protein [Hyphomicrobium sp.]|uniref:tetratricopeptide repeat protein n=1 Tax=Hyphomicrobium sp. TaxID=82 RepID=UPI002D79AD42|nr:tetratricopeptide repeat protein [Hyphomicrobium sp.]HET6388710.1 tetratricopeptide repeat protein [Hyphomicrobium sp.]